MKKNYLTSVFFLFFMLFVGFTTQAQETIEASELNNNWTMLSEKDGIQIFIKEEKCDVGATKPLTYAFIKFHNTTNVEKNVDFLFESHFDNACGGCGMDAEYLQSVTIPASASVEGDCSFEHSQLSIILHNPFVINPSKLDFIKLAHFKTK